MNLAPGLARSSAAMLLAAGVAVAGNWLLSPASLPLREIALDKGRAYRAGRVNMPAEVVVEGDRSVTGGLTGDYLRVDVRGDGWTPGQRVRARLRSDDGDNLYVESGSA